MKRPRGGGGCHRFLSRHRAAETTGGCATGKRYSPATLSSGAAAFAGAELVARLQSELGLGQTLRGVAADGVIVREHEVGNARHDLGTKPRTVEHPVMTH